MTVSRKPHPVSRKEQVPVIVVDGDEVCLPRNAYGQYIDKDGVPHPERHITPDTPAGYRLEEEDRRRMTVGKLVERLQNYNPDLEVLVTTRLHWGGGTLTEFVKHVRLHDVGGRSFLELVGTEDLGYFKSDDGAED